jgi:hypothetical protein
VIRFQLNSSKQGVKHYILRYTNLFVLYGIKRNCHSSGRNVVVVVVVVVVIPIHKKGDKTDCNNYPGISVLTTAYKILSNILLARLTLYVNEVTGDHQCGFRHNRSTTNQIFYIWQILKKKWKYNRMVQQLFIDFNKAYNSVKREVLYNILLEFGIPKKLVKLIKSCLNETYSKVHVGTLLSDKLSYSEWAETRCSIAIAFQFCFRI